MSNDAVYELWTLVSKGPQIYQKRDDIKLTSGSKSPIYLSLARMAALESNITCFGLIDAAVQLVRSCTASTILCLIPRMTVTSLCPPKDTCRIL